MHGTRCPLGAHIRRANPRNADLPGGPAGLLGRLIRTLGFGRKGFRERRDRLRPASTGSCGAGGSTARCGRTRRRASRAASTRASRGLYFIGLNANIGRQFEFVQSAWMMGTKFGGLAEESDPLVGGREPIPGCPVTSAFSLPQASGLRRRVTGLPQFVTVRGGAYFFLPGLRALRYLTAFGG